MDWSLAEEIPYKQVNDEKQKNFLQD